MTILKKLCIFVFLVFSTSAYSSQILFYTDNSFSNASLSNERNIQFFEKHANQIDIIAPQIYQIAKNGVVWGSIDPQVVSIARKYKVKIMPLAINQGFSQDDLHTFLTTPSAINRAIQALIALCQKNSFYGIQFDFENINIADKQLYTNFIKLAADALHKKGYTVSVTIVPRTSLATIKNQYDKFLVTNWSGAYDEKALASVTDFITLMAYDRHTSLTTPGPIAPIAWVKELVSIAIREVSPEKISLGIPVYSGFWSTLKKGQDFQGKEHQISHSEAMNYIKKYNLTVKWDDTTMTASAIDSNQGKGLYQYLYLEDARSFAAKYALVKQYSLRGISVWQLGLGDPLIWKEIPTR